MTINEFFVKLKKANPVFYVRGGRIRALPPKSCSEESRPVCPISFLANHLGYTKPFGSPFYDDVVRPALMLRLSSRDARMIAGAADTPDGGDKTDDEIRRRLMEFVR